MRRYLWQLTHCVKRVGKLISPRGHLSSLAWSTADKKKLHKLSRGSGNGFCLKRQKIWNVQVLLKGTEAHNFKKEGLFENEKNPPERGQTCFFPLLLWAHGLN